MSVDIRGTVDSGFEKVADAFAANFEEHDEVGAACAVYRDGRSVVDIWGGLADREAGREWAADTIVIAFSCTKGATAVCANRLIEQGDLDPDAPIAQYWPDFAANGKERIPVKWALSHRAGLAAVDGDLTLDDVAAWEPVVAAIAAQPTNWEPGTKHGYHARSYGWIVGEIIRRVSGRSPGTYFAEEVAAPLDLEFYIGLPEALEPRVARLYPAELEPDAQALADAVLRDQSTLIGRVMSGPSQLFGYDDMWNTRLLRGAEMPSSNGHGDARSLARMYAACISNVDGVRLLTDETVARATEVLSDGQRRTHVSDDRRRARDVRPTPRGVARRGRGRVSRLLDRRPGAGSTGPCRPGPGRLRAHDPRLVRLGEAEVVRVPPPCGRWRRRAL